MPYFSEAGYDCYAVSLRCQGGSDRPEGARQLRRSRAGPAGHTLGAVLAAAKSAPQVASGHAHTRHYALSQSVQNTLTTRRRQGGGHAGLTGGRPGQRRRVAAGAAHRSGAQLCGSHRAEVRAALAGAGAGRLVRLLLLQQQSGMGPCGCAANPHMPNEQHT